MSSSSEPIHDRLVDLARLPPGGRVVDLGCGTGPTLAAFARRDPRSVLTGLDRDGNAITEAAERLVGHTGTLDLKAADLAASPLPLPDACMDAVVSYNMLECLADPDQLLREVFRVLRPGGRAVLAHVDFDSLLFSGAPVALDRRVCHAYCDDDPPWMDSSDGRMGRRLPSLVARSPLRLADTEMHTTRSTRLDGHAADRAENIRASLAAAAARDASGPVSASDVERWHAALKEADATGQFFFAESAVIATARR